MVAMTLLVILGVYGMALDLARVYSRRFEFDVVARAAALAAAQQLNGTPAGVDNAVAEARRAVDGMNYDANESRVVWSDDALRFGAAPAGAWASAANARSDAAGIWFVQADTARLAAPQNRLALLVMGWLAPALATVPVAAQAVAGRAAIDVEPLAVCALDQAAAAKRDNPGGAANAELVEYGFRRGVGYDLMQLNPAGVTPANFVINPFAPPGQTGTVHGTTAEAVGPYACVGQLAMPRLNGGSITVAQPFPLAALFRQLNSRFNVYDQSLCTAATAPPDRNIKSYAYNLSAPWMAVAPGQQGALASTAGGKLRTIADPFPAPVGNQPANYGTLWAYARPVPYSEYAASAEEPAAGYGVFGTGSWAALYAPGPPTPASYPSGTATPYVSTSSTYALAPPAAQRGIASRRVLRVPLLACPVGANGAATVLGIGKFLLTVPATATSLHVEFGGIAPERALTGPVELYQ
jgi:hypothetical protein